MLKKQRQPTWKPRAESAVRLVLSGSPTHPATQTLFPLPDFPPPAPTRPCFPPEGSVETAFEAEAEAVTQAPTPSPDPSGLLCFFLIPSLTRGRAADHVIQREEGEMQGKTTAAPCPLSE